MDIKKPYKIPKSKISTSCDGYITRVYKTQSTPNSPLSTSPSSSNSNTPKILSSPIVSSIDISPRRSSFDRISTTTNSSSSSSSNCSFKKSPQIILPNNIHIQDLYHLIRL